MRLVTKINLALVGVIAVSGVLNFAALRMAVMPGFAALEEQAADQNQSRVMEAIELQKEQVANSAGDYAIWDDTYDFVNGIGEDYEEKNVTSESLKTLGVNFFVVLDSSGRIIIDKGFDHEAEEKKPLELFPSKIVSSSSTLVAKHDEIKIQSALIRTDQGLVVLGYAPILRSDRSGERAGTLILGRILDTDAIQMATKVDFKLIDMSTAHEVSSPEDNVLRRVDDLPGLDSKPVARLVSQTARDITAVGERTILTTLLLLIAAAALLLLALSFVLRRIAVNRIEKLRSHLNNVALTGKLGTLPEDEKGDELSETVQSFNAMANQLAELRDKLRKQDYEHGAADQAAGLLHNVRNAMSPVSALAWQLSRQSGTTLQQNLVKAVDQLNDPGLTSERAGKLTQFVVMSAARLIEEDAKRQDDLRSMVTMLRHIDGILKETDQSAQLERVVEVIDLEKSVRDTVHLVAQRGAVDVDLSGLHSAGVRGHKVPLDQVIANVLVNAAEAIEGTSRGSGRIVISTEEGRSAQGEAQVLLQIRDNGVGISKENLACIFEKGFSTKRDGKRGLGLHWCANTINAMGGKILVESLGADEGTTVTVVLPSQRTDKAAA